MITYKETMESNFMVSFVKMHSQTIFEGENEKQTNRAIKELDC